MISGAAAQSPSTEPALEKKLKEFTGDYTQTPSRGPDVAKAAEEVIERTNALRKKQGLEPVRQNDTLEKTTGYFASWMAHSGEYGHQADGNRPSDRAKLFDYDYCLISENIALDPRTARVSSKELGQNFYQLWYDSPGHRRNMLAPFVTETAVSIRYNRKSKKYYAVQMFGRPTSDAIRFQVVNRSDRDLSYSVRTVGEKPEKAKVQQLPRGFKRTHVTCTPPVVNAGWTEADDAWRIKTGTLLVITGEGDELQIAQEKIEKPSPTLNSQNQPGNSGN